jgi:transposase
VAQGAEVSAVIDEVTVLKDVVDSQSKQIEEQSQRISDLLVELRILRNGLFGRRRESIHPDQLQLFEGDLAPMEETEEVALPARTVTRKKKGHGRGQFPAHLPREEIRLVLPEAERCCPDCGDDMQAFGEEVCERGHIVPVKLVVHRYLRTKYACKKGHAVKTAPMPDGVVEGGKYEASVYAHVAVAKYGDHLPLNRLQGIFKRHGVHLPRQSMWDMLVRMDQLVAQPVLRQMRTELLQEDVLHADETPVTFRLEGAKGTKTGYIWGWRSLRERGSSKVLIEFKTSRARAGPRSFLGDWDKTLLTDGYSGYDEVTATNGIARAGCWVHARRKFKDALDAGIKSAALVLRPVQRLFWIERAIKKRAEARELDWEGLVELRRDVRRRRSMRLVNQIHAIGQQLSTLRSTLPKSALGKALRYLANQKAPLDLSISDARLPIHNNDAERDLRHIAVGRKNWLIFASERGGAVASRIYSLMLSCKEAGVDPESYLEDVLSRVSTTSDKDIAELTPWAWAAALRKETSS